MKPICSSAHYSCYTAIQTMDEAVLDPCKHRFKRKCLAHIIIENEAADKTVLEILKAITIKDVVYWEQSA